MRLCGSKPPADAADPAHPLLAAEDLLFDEEPLFAVLVDDELGRPVAKTGVQIVVPQGERLQYVAIGINYVVGAGHGPSPHRQW